MGKANERKIDFLKMGQIWPEAVEISFSKKQSHNALNTAPWQSLLPIFFYLDHMIQSEMWNAVHLLYLLVDRYIEAHTDPSQKQKRTQKKI